MRIIGNNPQLSRQTQAVASGAITGGKPVLVNTNGTVSQVSGSVTLTAENYIGIAEDTVATGQSVTVNTKGAVDENQTGLTAGQLYFVQTDGTLGIAADDPSVIAGTAVAATKLIVKG